MFRFIRLIENALYPVRWARSWMGRLFRFGGKSFKLSTAGKAALTWFILFFLVWLIAWVMYAVQGWTMRQSFAIELFNFTDPNNWIDFPIILLFIIISTLFAYWCVRLAVVEPDSLYPEIDRCWDAIEGWRNERSFDWNEFSRYVVLGSDYAMSKIMHVDDAENKDEPLIPVGSEEWIHAFGNKRDMYIHLNATCNTSRRISKLSRKGGKEKFKEDSYKTLVADDPFGDSLDAHDDDHEGYGGVTEEIAPIGGDIGTIDPNNDIGDPTSDSVDIPGNIDRQGIVPDDNYEEDDHPDDRLEYYCNLAKRRSDSELPFGAVLVAIPFDTFTEENFQSITEAVRRDLVLLRRTANVNFPVVFAFTAMETDNGFPKLQNLLGKQRAKSRFGAGCQPQSPPVLGGKNFDLQVARACKTFETWVFDRWAKNSQLSKAMQNKDLYKMVVRIRQGFKHRLDFLLNNSLLWKDSELPEGEQNELVLAGCYFVSTGNNPGSRGFLPGLFQKCKEFSQLTGWSESAILRDRIFATLATLLFLLSIIAILATLFFFFAQFRT